MDKTEQDLRESASCDFCSTQYTPSDWNEGGAHDFRIRDDALYYYDSQCGWEGIEVKYCPMCGRGLEPVQPLTLDELRKMNGKPVWCESLRNGQGEWAILRIVEMSKSWFIALAGAERGFGDKDNYGKIWLAYRRKPEQED